MLPHTSHITVTPLMKLVTEGAAHFSQVWDNMTELKTYHFESYPARRWWPKPLIPAL